MQLMLLNMCSVHDHELFMNAQQHKLSISEMKRQLPTEDVDSILFAHGITGNDTVSKPHSVGKITAVEKMPILMQQRDVFMDPNSTHEIRDAGEHSLMVLCGVDPALGTLKWVGL